MGWEEILLVIGGILLLIVEAFVVPGFGIAGILGILGVIAGLVLSMIGSGASAQFIMLTATRVLFAVVFALVVSLVLLRFLPRLPFGRQLVLQTGLDPGKGYVSAPPQDLHWLGKRGRASSTLRPAGIAEFNGQRVDVVSEGELIDAGEPIVVIRVDGNRIVVKKVEPLSEREET